MEKKFQKQWNDQILHYANQLKKYNFIKHNKQKKDLLSPKILIISNISHTYLEAIIKILPIIIRQIPIIFNNICSILILKIYNNIKFQKMSQIIHLIFKNK